MPLRTFQHKSRHGCTVCKQRKKRCDLQRPACGVCKKHELMCNYPDFLGSISLVGFGAPRLTLASKNRPHSLYRAISNQSRFVDAADLELAAHFLQTDPVGFTAIPGLNAIRQLDFADKAPRYPYLLHGVLAISALHIASTRSMLPNEADTYATRARVHQQLALWSCIRSLNRIDSQSCHFIFGFSLVLADLQLAFYSSPRSQSPCTHEPDTLIDTICANFQLMQGAVSIAEAANTWIPVCGREPVLISIRAMLHCKDHFIDTETDEALQELILQIAKQRTCLPEMHSSKLRDTYC